MAESRRRLEACHYACEGIPTEALESGVVAEMMQALERIGSRALRITKGRVKCTPFSAADYDLQVALPVLAKLGLTPKEESSNGTS